jgi:hypothetical protein
MCKVLDPCQLDNLEIYPTHNRIENNIGKCARTPNAQARVWQPATATALAAAKHMLFILHRLQSDNDYVPLMKARIQSCIIDGLIS